MFKSEENFTEDYADHIDQICDVSYEAVWSAMEDSSMTKEIQEVLKTFLEQAYEAIVLSNAERYFDYFNRSGEP